MFPLHTLFMISFICQCIHSLLHNELSSDWLLLQTSVPVVREGQSFLLRCHGWKNLNVYKVIYYKDGKALKYWYENHNLSITNAKREDSGSYWCTGIIQKIPKNSTTLTITIQTGELVREREGGHSREKGKEHLNLKGLQPLIRGQL